MMDGGRMDRMFNGRHALADKGKEKNMVFPFPEEKIME